jgi:uncharacterized surface protein with fasciclin (FAS1) repeats
MVPMAISTTQWRRCICVLGLLPALFIEAVPGMAGKPDMPPQISPPIIFPAPTGSPLLRGGPPKAAPTIMDFILGSGDLTALMSAVMATDISTTLAAPGSITLFAPTNSAFDKLPQSARAALMLPANKAVLTRVLSHHVLNGTLTSKELASRIQAGGGKAVLTMLSGQAITASLQGASIILTDGAGNQSRITVGDKQQGNGIVHQVDSLLLPQPPR